MRLIYLAHPVEGAAADEAMRVQDTKVDIRTGLQARGMTVYDPSAAFGGPVANIPNSRLDDRVYKIDHRVVTLADGVLFVHGRSVGSGMEIEKACGLAIPVVALIPKDTVFSAMLVRPGVQIIHDIDGAVELMDMLSQAFQESERQRKVQRMLVSGFGEMPTQTYGDDAGFDLYASEDTKIESGRTELVPFDISVQMPPGYWAWITGRSSMIRNRNLLVTSGIIDHGYRGPLFANVTNMNGEAITIAKGERVAQLIPMGNHAPTMRPVRVGRLDPSERGEKGFGSSGQ